MMSESLGSDLSYRCTSVEADTVLSSELLVLSAVVPDAHPAIVPAANTMERSPGNSFLYLIIYLFSLSSKRGVNFINPNLNIS